jgi:hypothetical protein
MSKRTPLETFNRAAVINGTAPAKPKAELANADFVCITERHGKRQMRLSHISQVVYDVGQIGGPWFVRIDGQQLPVSVDNAKLILGLLGLTMEDAKV